MSQQINSRVYADLFDRPVEVKDEGSFGVGRDPDSITGCAAMGWYEYFRSRETGEVYRVLCTDGEHGGKGAHRDSDLRLIEGYYRHITQRTKSDAKKGAMRIVLSSREWHIMLGHTHYLWLDGADAPGFDRSYCEGDSGQIGTICGILVCIEPTASDDLDALPPPSFDFEPVIDAYGPKGNVFGTIGDLMSQ